MFSSLLPQLKSLRRGLLSLAGGLLLIEFLDELVFGAGEAAWPLIRSDLGLTYLQIGLLLSLPRLVGSALEPFLGVLADQGWRRRLILGGGLAFALACLLTGLAPSFALLLAAFCLFNPASGAFVSLSQTALMDTDPRRHDQLMARWTLAGSLGVVAGPLLLGLTAWLGLSWRGAYLGVAAGALALTALVWPRRLPPSGAAAAGQGLRAGLGAALRALTRPAVLRWLVLLEFADFMLDILLGFLALYLVDTAGATPEQAALGVAVWTGAGLVGDALLIPLLERVRGLAYLRLSALIVAGLYPAFLLTPGFGAKLIWLALLGLFNSGWYAILKGRLYSALPGQSGTVLAVDAFFGLAAGFLPALLGWAAEQFGLPGAMWLLLLGPLALLIGLPTAGPAAGDQSADPPQPLQS
ncbi:MAG: MFS transporter [Anaerolineales bacterium]|nr:MFS transporter [Anaerolineales bacterium]